MAVWQFPVALVPREWATRNRERIVDYLGVDGWDLSDAWNGFRHHQRVEQIIDRYMVRGRSWADQVVLYGDEKKHDVHLSYQNGQIEGLSLRIDLRNDYAEMIENAVSLAEELDCSILVMEKCEIISPSVEMLMSFALGSRASKDVAIRGKSLDYS